LGIIAKIQLSGEYIDIIIDDEINYLADCKGDWGTRLQENP